ncbi:MAG: phage portal protein, partial [Sulfobacillus sp.]
MSLTFQQRVKAAVGLLFGDPAALDPFEIGWNLFARYSSMPRRAGAQWLRTYSEHPRLRAPVHRIATDVSAVDWEVYELDKDDPTDNGKRKNITRIHPLGELLHKGNSWHDGPTIRFLGQVNWEILGERFNIMKRAYLRPPEELWFMPSHWVMGLPSEATPYFKCQLRGMSLDVPPENMMFAQDPDPLDPYNRGVGHAYAVDDEVSADEYAAKFNNQFFRNGASPGHIFGVKGITPEQGKALQKKFDQQAANFWNAFKTHFLPAEFTHMNLGNTHKDMDFIEGRKFLRDIIYQTWGVPPEILGIVEDSNRATAEAAMWIYGMLILTPRLNKLRAEYNRYLVQLYRDKQMVVVDYTNP